MRQKLIVRHRQVVEKDNYRTQKLPWTDPGEREGVEEAGSTSD